MKKCSKCRKEKSFDFFWKHKGTKDGFQHYCKDCSKPYRVKLNKNHNEWAMKKLGITHPVGIYGIYNKEELAYIGMSRELGKRINKHLMGFTSVNVIPKEDRSFKILRYVYNVECDLESLEEFFIKTYNPLLNVKKTNKRHRNNDE